jgi:hypothetical protein
MLETPHVLVGAAIASKITNPLLSIPISLVSHFVLEKVPHWNPHLNTETEKFGKPTTKSTIIALIDVTTSLIAGSYIAFRAYPNTLQVINILACCFVASLPDVVEAPYFFLGIRNKAMKKWIEWQKSIQIDTKFFLGMATQITTILASIYWIFSK